MSALDRTTVDRLIKLLGLLGGVHDGERAAAGVKAHELLKRSGPQWADVIAVPPPPVIAQPSWREMALACCQHAAHLSAKERAFVGSMATWRGTPTPKQLAWLTRIYEALP
jgi:hypothetical protein